MDINGAGVQTNLFGLLIIISVENPAVRGIIGAFPADGMAGSKARLNAIDGGFDLSLAAAPGLIGFSNMGEFSPAV